MAQLWIILSAIYTFLAKYGPAAKPIIESVLQSALAAGKISQATYDAAITVLNILIPTLAGHRFAFAANPTEAEFKALAGL